MKWGVLGGAIYSLTFGTFCTTTDNWMLEAKLILERQRVSWRGERPFSITLGFVQGSWLHLVLVCWCQRMDECGTCLEWSWRDNTENNKPNKLLHQVNNPVYPRKRSNQNQLWNKTASLSWVGCLWHVLLFVVSTWQSRVTATIWWDQLLLDILIDMCFSLWYQHGNQDVKQQLVSPNGSRDWEVCQSHLCTRCSSAAGWRVEFQIGLSQHQFHF